MIRIGNLSLLEKSLLSVKLQQGVVFLEKGLELPKSLNLKFIEFLEISEIVEADERDLILISKPILKFQVAAQVVETNNIDLAKVEVPSEFSEEQIQKIPALLLDRDGVILKFVDYLSTSEKTELMPGIEKLIAKARELGWKVFVITNQSGIGRGLFDWQDCDEVHFRMQQLLAEKGQWLDGILVSPYYENAEIIEGVVGQPLRKPSVGSLLKLKREHRVDLLNSIFVGDSKVDIELANNANLKDVYLLESKFSQNKAKDIESHLKYKRVTDILQVELA